MKDEIKEILDEYITDNEWIVIATNVLKYLKDYITTLQEENENLKDFNTKLQATKDRLDRYDRENQMRIDKAINKIDRIIDYGFDYDGFDNKEDLKKLIDMLVEYAKESKDILQGDDNNAKD